MPDEGKPSGAVVRIAGWSMRHRWTAVLGWIFVVGLVYLTSVFTGLVEQEDADSLTGDAARAERLLDGADFAEQATENVLIQAETGQLDEATAGRVVADLRQRYDAVQDVRSVGQPIPSADGRSMLLPVELDRGTGENRRSSASVVGPMLTATKDADAAHQSLRIEQVGAGSISREFSVQADKDFQRAEFISIPVTFLILVLAFGSLVAAGVPLLLGLTAVGFGLGLSTVASHVLPAHDTQASLVLLLGLAVGVDYSLFYLRRVREQRAAGSTPDDALRIAAATSGRAVVVSGVAVVVAMAGMFFTGSMIFSSLAIGAILVVGVAVLGSVTVLPAVLALLGDRAEKLAVPWLSKRSGAGRESRFWNAVLRPVLRVPAVALLLGVLVMGALAWPITSMVLKMPGDNDLPQRYPVVQTLNRVSEAFPGQKASHTVVVEAPAAQRANVEQALDRLVGSARADSRFAFTRDPRIVTSADGTVTKVSLSIPDEPDTRQAENSLDALRTDLVPRALDGVQVTQSAVGGQTAFSTDFSRVQSERLPLVVGFVVVLCLIVMLAAFRSVILAVVTALLNLLSVAAAYGVLVLVFQGTWAEGLLDFQSMDAVVAWIPLVLFVVLFGLSMDYHVFVLSRIREGVVGGLGHREAIRRGVSTSAGVVTSAAVVMIAVFAVFVTLSTLEMKQLGVGLAVAILLDATLVRGVLLPGVLALLRRHAWGRVSRPVRSVPLPEPGDETVGAARRGP